MLKALLVATSLTVPTTALGPVQVVDGDTIKVGAETIRVLGLDAPETHGHCRAEVEGAARAKARLAALLVRSRKIEILRSEKRDKYRRTLATIMVDGRDVALILIGEGLARPYKGKRRLPWC